jgi:hypothetical protein
MTEQTIDEMLEEEGTFEPLVCAQDAIFAAVERLIEAADCVHDKLTAKETAPLAQALNHCFAAIYFMNGWTDGDTVEHINDARREMGKPYIGSTAAARLDADLKAEREEYELDHPQAKFDEAWHEARLAQTGPAYDGESKGSGPDTAGANEVRA